MSRFNKKYLSIKQKLGALFLTTVLLVPQLGWAGIGDGLTDLEKKELWTRLKKINVRLAELETQNLRALQESQNMILLKIQELQRVIPQLQGNMEQNRVALDNQLASMTSELAELSSQTQKDRNQLFEEWKKLREEITLGIEGIRQGIAQDVENLASKNQEFLTTIQSSNESAMGKVAQGLVGQNEKLSKTQSIIREELIPAIAQQGKQSVAAMTGKLESMTTRLDSFQKKQTNDLAEFQKNIQGALATIDTKTRGMAEILQKSLALQKSANENITTTGEYVFSIRQSLPGLSKKIDSISKDLNANYKVTENHLKIVDEKTSTIGEGLKILISKFNDLGQSVTTLYSNVARLEEQNKNNAQKLLEKNQEIKKGVSEVVTRAITKNDAQATTLNSKLDSTSQKVQESTNLANQKLTKLIEILKALVAAQGEGDMDRLLGEVKEALADLRRKANVNISRSNDIKKAQKEIKSAVQKILSPEKPNAKP